MSTDIEWEDVLKSNGLYDNRDVEQTMRQFDKIIAEIDSRKRSHPDYMFLEAPPKKLYGLQDITKSAKTQSQNCIASSKNDITEMEISFD
ncbi:hypothetical protein [Enterococcus ratti]|uniref:Uncharacterized protein n=1 Tax=Enterococcus ratti TaxID=150033 RepID=A0A1L8WB51_9ENTE|nr:hypothetical protein [Enterococcus ratti]OJG78267.1 hypothetical protein RV14_GL001208 [Enterococcus ratti]